MFPVKLKRGWMAPTESGTLSHHLPTFLPDVLVHSTQRKEKKPQNFWVCSCLAGGNIPHEEGTLLCTAAMVRAKEGAAWPLPGCTAAEDDAHLLSAYVHVFK